MRFGSLDSGREIRHGARGTGDGEDSAASAEPVTRVARAYCGLVLRQFTPLAAPQARHQRGDRSKGVDRSRRGSAGQSADNFDARAVVSQSSTLIVHRPDAQRRLCPG